MDIPRATAPMATNARSGGFVFLLQPPSAQGMWPDLLHPLESSPGTLQHVLRATPRTDWRSRSGQVSPPGLASGSVFLLGHHRLSLDPSLASQSGTPSLPFVTHPGPTTRRHGLCFRHHHSPSHAGLPPRALSHHCVPEPTPTRFPDLNEEIHLLFTSDTRCF